MSTIKFGPLSIDAAAYGSQGSAVLGIRDSGKTYTATLMAERLFETGIPFIAFDPIGVWRFLQVPGKCQGYPVVVAGGQAGNLPLSPASAPAIVEAAMRNGVSLVIDLFSIELSKADWRRIVRDCVRLLLHKNQQHGLRHVFIEEAAEFVPQRVVDGEVYAEVEKLARMGGNRGLGYTLINQRAEEVNKAVLELCDNLFLHRQKGRNSLTALSKWLDVGNVKNGKAIIDTLATLPTGECWAWMQGTDQPVRVKVPAKNSLHPDRRVMRDAATTSAKAAVDVGSFVDSLKAVLPKLEEEAAANDPKKLRAELAALKRQMESAVAGHLQPASKDQLTAEYRRGFGEGAAQAEARMGNLLRSINSDLERVRADVLTGLDRFNGIRERIADYASVAPPSAPPATPTFTPSVKPAPKTSAPPPEGVTKAEMRVLQVLASRHPARFSMGQWAALAGMKKSGGTWNGYVRKLSALELIDDQGGQWGATAAGLKAAGTAEDLPTTSAELIAMWRQKLGGGAAKVLDELVRVYPDGMHRANLADKLGMAASGGTFNAYVRLLRSNGVATEDRGGHVRAADILFGG